MSEEKDQLILKLYRELAELKLQVTTLTQRHNMLNRECWDLRNTQATTFTQVLEQFGAIVLPDGTIAKALYPVAIDEAGEEIKNTGPLQISIEFTGESVSCIPDEFVASIAAKIKDPDPAAKNPTSNEIVGVVLRNSNTTLKNQVETNSNPDEYDEHLKDARVKDIEDPIQRDYSTSEKGYF